MSSARVIASVSDADSGDSGVWSIVGVIGGQMRAHGDTEQMAALPSPGNMRPVSTLCCMMASCLLLRSMIK